MARPDSEAIGDSGAATGAHASHGSQARVGGKALAVLAAPLNFQIIRALSDRPMRLAELRKETGLPAQTTLRGHLANLVKLGVLTKRPTRQMPYAVENELTPLGLELLAVADHLEIWLEKAPDGPIALEMSAAKGAIKALVDGWESKMMRALAARPLSLTQLDRLIAELSYPALERRLASMRLAGLVEAQPGQGGGGTPYAVTTWARLGVAPLMAASHCERLHMGKDSAPVTQIDIEAAFLLATPLVGLAPDVAGSCQLEVEAGPNAAHGPTGVRVTLERGQVVSCVSQLGKSPDAFAAGTPLKWFRAVQEGSVEQLRFGAGDRLSRAVVHGLHSALADPHPASG